MSDLGGLLQLFVGPGLIAALVSLYIGGRAEKRRARRDFLTKTFGEVRDTILKATEYAIDYFSTPGKRTPKQEAYVSLYEREVRRSVLFIQENAVKECSARIDEVTVALVDFLALLTGGDFQSPKGKADLQHVRDLGFASASLRSALNDLRNAELEHDMNQRWFGAAGALRPLINARGYRG